MLVLLYLIAHHAQSFGWGPETFRFYMKDVLIVPLVISAVGIVMGIFTKDFKPGKKETIIAVVYITLVFEIILPLFGTKFAFDPADVVCYAAGGLLYYIWLREVHSTTVQLKSS